MPSNIMPEKKAIVSHLSDSPPVPLSDGRKLKIISGFAACLKDTRVSTGRDPQSGNVIDPQKTGSWLGSIGYMVLLDQIGSCFKPKNVQLARGNSIMKALGHFANLGNDEKQVIYALRCALAHDYSLYNINAKEPKLTHNFALTKGSGFLIRMPNTQWDGNYQNRNANNQTLVDLQELGNLVENICKNLFELANKDELEVILTNGTDELIQRYSFQFFESCETPGRPESAG